MFQVTKFLIFKVNDLNQHINIFKIDCGIPKIQPRILDDKIVGGQTAIPHSWPWQAYISDGYTFCGASLISDQVRSFYIYRIL